MPAKTPLSRSIGNNVDDHVFERTVNCAAAGPLQTRETVRYVGIEVFDALEMAEQTEVYSPTAGWQLLVGR